MLYLIIGPSGYGKTETLVLKIKELVEKDEGKRIFVIVPEQDSVKTEALLLERCGNKVNKSVEVLNFSRLANRVFREAGGMTYKYVDSAGRDLIVALLVEKIKSFAPTFEKIAGDTKYIQTIRAEMDTLRMRKIHAEDIERVKEKLISEDKGGAHFLEKLSDLSLALATYEKALKEDVTDATDDITRLAETLFDFDFFEDSYVFIDGFYDYTLAQYDVIERIMCSATDTYVTFSLALPDHEEIFRRTSLALKTIRDRAEKNLIDLTVTTLDENRRTENEALLSLSKAVMTGGEERCENSDGVKLTALKSPYDECVYVAREIVKLVKNGASFGDIAITASNIKNYGTMLENVLEAYGITFLNCTERSVLQTPPVSLALLALDVINSGFFINNVRTYLKSSYLGLSEEEAFLLENYITLWNIGKKQWCSEGDWTMNPRGYVEEATATDKRELSIVNSARKKVSGPLLALLDGFKDRSSTKQKAKALVDYFDTLGVYEKICESSKASLEKGKKKEAEDEISSWNALLSAIDMLVSFSGDTPIGRDRFIKYMRLVLSDMSFGKIPSSLNEVEIGDVEFVRNKSVKHLFFMGFNEGEFPSASTTESIFTESERDFLRANDLEIDESGDDRMKDQTFIFLLSVLRPEKTLEFTYHTSSSESSKAVASPSYFASIIKETLDVTPTFVDISTLPPVDKEELREYLISTKDTISEYIIKSERLDDAFFEECEKLKAFLERGKDSVNLDGAERFIDKEIPMTQSRFDKFKRCRYSYFLEYMLKTRTRRKAEISSLEIGSFVHKILEIVLKNVSQNGGDITTVEMSVVQKEAERVTVEYISKISPDLENDSPKYKYLLESISSFAVFVIENIREEFSASLFKPRYFEEDIANSKETKQYEVVSKDGTKMRFYGIVDRVDTFVDSDNTEYIRVVDYKSHTGGKVFSLEDVLNGLNLQMLIYLFSFTKKTGDKERREAGIMYMPTIKAQFKPTDTEASDDELIQEIGENLKRSGLYLKDTDIINAMESGEEKRFMDLKRAKGEEGYAETKLSSLVTLEQFGLIERYINHLFEDVLCEIKSGNISPDPLESEDGKSSACDWCQYHPICRFEGEARERKRSKTPLIDMEEELK